LRVEGSSFRVDLRVGGLEAVVAHGAPLARVHHLHAPARPLRGRCEPLLSGLELRVWVESSRLGDALRAQGFRMMV